MIYEDITISGSFDISQKLDIPIYASENAHPTPKAGNIFHDSSLNVIKIYTGTQWSVIGSQTAILPSANIEYLVVAGGGAGGYNAGGGGGAGGLLSSSLSSVESGSSLTITVGAGAAVNSGGDGDNGSDSSIAGSTITTITSTGGGGGGGREPSEYAGYDGGSGGGSSTDSTGFAGGSGTAGQGNDGGGDTANAFPGGGGGAGAAGITSGNGGDGKQSAITGTSTYYAGGGGIGYSVAITNGGQGGGGDGINATDASAAATRAGEVNTGGGGAGGYNSSGKKNGGSGGSGVVILAYASSSMNAAGGIVGDAGNGRKYHQFNESGTFKAGSTSDFSITTGSLSVNYDAGNFASRGTSTWTDLQNNSYSGTVTNAVLGNKFYYEFDGNDYIQFPTGFSTLFEGSSAVSVELWFFQPTTIASAPLFAKYASNVQVGGYQFVLNANGYQQTFIANTSDSRLVAATSTAVTANAWNHLVYVYDGSQSITNGTGGRLQFFLNSTEVSCTYSFSTNHTTIPSTSTTGIKQNRLGIVNYSDGSSANATGNFAQFRVYGKALTAAEVLQNYNATKTNFV